MHRKRFHRSLRSRLRSEPRPKGAVLPAALGALAATLALAQSGAPIAAGALKADVSFLASDALQGRGTPSPGLDIAAEFIAAQFRGAGLAPAGGDGYFQTASFAAVTPNLEGLDVAIESNGGESTIRPAKGSITLLEPGAADLSHAAVVKTTPDGLDKLTAADVQRKALAIEMPDGANFGGLHTAMATAAKLRPALVIVARSRGRGMNSRILLRELSEPAPVPVLAISDPAFRQALDANTATISAHIAAPAVAPVKLRNVIGLVRGSDPALQDTYLIVTAHYDHLGVRGGQTYNGANDDASGTASVIELAKALARGHPRRSIVFMTLFGEEEGEVGSRYYCRHPVFSPARTVAEINLEQLGRTDDSEGPHVRQFNLTGFDYTDLAPEFAKAGQAAGIAVVKHPVNSDAFFARSDNAAFAEIGIPSTTVSVSYVFPDYHQPGDKWEKLDYDNMARVDGAIAAALIGIANNPAAPQWNAANPKTAPYRKARQ